MRLRLLEGSRVLIDLRATGMLRALAHSPTLTARTDGLTVELAEGGGEAALDAAFRVEAIEAPADIPAGDREKMQENLRGREVLDAARFPTVDLHARYRGDLEGGTLAGALRVRGTDHLISMPIRVSRTDGIGAITYTAAGHWEGKLTDLGVKPFKALLGAIKLDDYIRLRIEARFSAIRED
jgi:hypothetical protein